MRSRVLVCLAFKASGTALALQISLEYSGHRLLLSFVRCGTLLRESLGAAVPDCTVEGGRREHASGGMPQSGQEILGNTPASPLPCS